MICRLCHKAAPDGAYCIFCGKRQDVSRAGHKRGNGQGTAYKRGKKWEGCRPGYQYTDENGNHRVRPRKCGFATKREALEWASVKTVVDIHSPKVIELWEQYRDNDLPKLGASKQTAYKIARKHLEPLMGMEIHLVTLEDIQKTVNASCPTYYPARDCKQLLKNLYKLAAADGWVNGSLPDYILLPERNERERQPFTIDEQRAIWASYEAGNADAALPLVMIYTGMMPGELQQLRPEMIDWKARRIVGAGLKTKVRRESPIWIPDGLVPVLRDLVDASTSESGYILPRNESAFYARYYAALERAGVRRLEPYSCRHTTATALAIDNGVAPQTIQRIMRWSTTRMLDRYAHPDDATAQATVSGIIPGAHEKNAAR